MIWIALFYLTSAVLTFGICNADMRWEHMNKWRILNEGPRDSLGICCLEAMLGPIGLIAMLFATNFCQHGWTLSMKDWRKKEAS